MQQCPILDTNTRNKYQLPAGGTWFHVQKPALEMVQQEGGFLVAWDKLDSGAKVYGVYENVETFYCNLLVASDRCGYEIIPADTRCVLYLDVEWKGQEDNQQIRTIVQKLREYCQPSLDRNLKVFVCCGSRFEKSGNFKNSYHLSVPTLTFRNNHDGCMKAFVSKFCEQYDCTSHTNEKGEKQCVVDLSVYSTNRCIRLPHCCKRGTSVPFARISGDPEDVNDSFVSHFDIHDHESWRPFILSNPTEDSVLMEVQIPLKRPSSNTEATEPKRPKTTDMPVPPGLIEEALAQSGDSVSKVTKAPCKDGMCWQIQCDQRGQQRTCLHIGHKKHNNNNCILFMRPVPGSGTSLVLQYHCTSQKCRQEQNLVLGTFTFEDFRWKFTRDPVETTEAGSLSPEVTLETINTDDPEENQYEAVKARFELFVFKIRKPFRYGLLDVSETQPELTYLGHQELQNFFVHLYYQTNKKRESFIKRWLMDKNKREVSKVEVDPTCTKTNIYNLWVPYLAETVTLSLSFAGRHFSNEDAAKHYAVEPIFKHILEVIACDNRVHADYILDWLAQIAQKPAQPTGVAFLLYGEQGAGKGLIFDFMRKHVFGPKQTYQTDNPEAHLFGRFANGLVAKTLVQVDEVKNLHTYVDVLKNCITAGSMNYEMKGKDPATMPNFANLVFTSNNENSLHVSSDDRRLVLFRCSSKYIGDSTYFDSLVAHMETEGVNAWFLKFLKDRDLSKYSGQTHFQRSRPITAYYKECQTSAIPPMKMFLSAFVNSNTSIPKIGSQVLFNTFIAWASAQNFKHLMTSKSFGIEMTRLANEQDSGVKKSKAMTSNNYEIDKTKLKAFLQKKKQYEEDVSISDERWCSSETLL